MPGSYQFKKAFQTLALCAGAASLIASANASSADFEILKALTNQTSANPYLKQWGKPDVFMTSLLPGSPGGRIRRVDYWVYAKHGVEILLENGIRVRNFQFNPTESNQKIFTPADTSPMEFDERTTMDEIKKKFGEPANVKQESVGGRKTTTFQFPGGYKTFVFVEGKLSFVSVGIAPNMRNPYLDVAEVFPDNPAELLGTWQSNLGVLTLTKSPINPNSFEGNFNPYKPIPGTAGNSTKIFEGSFDKKTGFIKFVTYKEWTGHAELIVSPDGKSMVGSLVIDKTQLSREANYTWSLWR